MNRDLASLRARRAELHLQKREIRNTLRATRAIGLSSSLVSGGSNLVLAALDAELIEIDRAIAESRSRPTAATGSAIEGTVHGGEPESARDALENLLGDLDERLTESGVRLFRSRNRTQGVDESAFAAFFQLEIEQAAQDAVMLMEARAKRSFLDFTHPDVRRLWLIAATCVFVLIIAARCLGP